MEQFQAKALKLEPEEVTASEHPSSGASGGQVRPGHRAAFGPLRPPSMPSRPDPGTSQARSCPRTPGRPPAWWVLPKHGRVGLCDVALNGAHSLLQTSISRHPVRPHLDGSLRPLGKNEFLGTPWVRVPGATALTV